MAKRFALVGTGGRATMFVTPIVERFNDASQLVALCDPNPARIEFYNQQIEKAGRPRAKAYHSDDFDKMIRETKPDTVIVCTVDALHDKYIIRAMELGCDVITEKPMTISAEKCRAVMDAQKKYGKNLRVTFNYRWAPGTTLVKRLISEGVIGDVIHVDMEYLLNTSHGADYFRRWHREKDKSGGLMVHKSTHHFDLINWWIDSVPDTVFGFGRLAFYGRENAEKRGIKVKYDRYAGQSTADDPFALDITKDEHLRKLYLEPEKHDGYVRDRNVFGDNITIEDTMSVLVKYRTGIALNYSLNAYLPKEGFTVVFNGTKGRLEFTEAHGTHIIGSAEASPDDVTWESSCIVHPMFGKAYKVEIPVPAAGGHGGSDPLIQEQMFASNPPNDPWGRNARHGQGAASILIGCAANQSFASGLPVKISDLCPQLGPAKKLSELP